MTSAALKRTRPVQSSYEPQQPPQLRIIESKAGPRAALPFVVVTILAVLALVVVNMYLTTQMQQASYYLSTKTQELTSLTEETQMLEQKLQVASSPSALQKAATDQGMVPAGPSGFITLSTGKVNGGYPATK